MVAPESTSVVKCAKMWRIFHTSEEERTYVTNAAPLFGGIFIYVYFYVEIAEEVANAKPLVIFMFPVSHAWRVL